MQWYHQNFLNENIFWDVTSDRIIDDTSGNSTRSSNGVPTRIIPSFPDTAYPKLSFSSGNGFAISGKVDEPETSEIVISTKSECLVIPSFTVS